MLADNKSNKARKTSDFGVTILTAGCHFNGKLYCRGSTRIAGRVVGEIVSEGILVIEVDALVQATVRAEEVIVLGRVNGKVEASQRIEIGSTGDFEGDVTAPAFSIAVGGKFNGNCRMPASAVDSTGVSGKNKKNRTDVVPESVGPDIRIAN